MRINHGRLQGWIIIIAGLVLIAAAAFLIGRNEVNEQYAEVEGEKLLEDLKVVLEEERVHDSDGFDPLVEAAEPAYLYEPEIPMPVVMVDDARCVALMQMPSLGIELPVNESFSYEALRSAPCRYSGSTYKDDLVICAHSYRHHFGNIGSLNAGDPVVLYDMDGNRFEYRVILVETLHPYDTDKMVNSEWDLSLFTCTPDGSDRITVRCAREDDGVQYVEIS